MYIIIYERRGLPHIVEQKTNKGTYYAFCGKAFGKFNFVNKTSIDGCPNNVCPVCRDLLGDEYLYNLNNDLSHARSSMHLTINNYSNEMEMRYEDILGIYWRKLRKYRRLLDRRK